MLLNRFSFIKWCKYHFKQHYHSSLYFNNSDPIIDRINKSLNDINNINKSKKFINIKHQFKELEYKLDDNNIWNENSKLANKLSQEISPLRQQIDLISDIELNLHETIELLQLARDDNNNISVINDCELMIDKLELDISNYHLESMMNGKYDKSNCFLQIIAGAGGTESCDWVKMLSKMYLKWAISEDFITKIMDENKDDDSLGGYRSITIKIIGNNSYGMCKADAGVHRLVRISPFDPQQKRHTSFAQVLVSPYLDTDLNDEETNKITSILPSDIKIDTFKSSGPGGQHVNTTDSAVRVTHIPTNTVVSCQNERSQHQNKAMALGILSSKLLQIDIDNKKNLQNDLTIGNKGENSWGNQIRSVVLNPYKIVKDSRSGFELNGGLVDVYLNGENKLLSEAMLKYLKMESNE
jgi:peptide chain release factor 2